MKPKIETTTSARRAARFLPSCALAAIVTITGCGESQPRSAGSRAMTARCGPDVQHVAERLGQNMRLVSLLAPDTVVRSELAQAYGSLVTGELLATWQATPASAPGREVSNPWPARVEVRSVRPDGGDCLVEGDVIYVASGDTTSPVERRAVTMRVDGRTERVKSYEVETTNTAADVVRRYYDAIQARDYDRAFALWSDGGRASGKNRAQFAAGFAQTASVRVTIDDSARVEGAAGSQYSTLPVSVDAVLRDGRRQHFSGTYTLRRSMVDGATPEQRAWRIYRAELRTSASSRQRSQ